MQTYEVPASWAKITVVGPYRIVPAVRPTCPVKRPSREWLFYRLYKGEEHISDHGSRDGAIYAAKNPD